MTKKTENSESTALDLARWLWWRAIVFWTKNKQKKLKIKQAKNLMKINAIESKYWTRISYSCEPEYACCVSLRVSSAITRISMTKTTTEKRNILVVPRWIQIEVATDGTNSVGHEPTLFWCRNYQFEFSSPFTFCAPEVERSAHSRNLNKKKKEKTQNLSISVIRPNSISNRNAKAKLLTAIILSLFIVCPQKTLTNKKATTLLADKSRTQRER